MTEIEQDTKATILVVDDSVANIEVINSSLGSSNYNISIARNGETALHRAKSLRPDLILLDIKMPGMDGFEVCKHLKSDEETVDIPVIFMTALYETDDKVKAFNLGAVDYVTKPIDRQELNARVETHISFHKVKNELKQKNQILEMNAQKQKRVEQILRHDLKSPLQAIVAIPELLISMGDLNSEQSELLHLLNDSGRNILQMVNSSLTLYKMENGTYQVAYERVDVLDVLKKVIGVLDSIRPGVYVQVSLDGSIELEGKECTIDGEEALFFSLFSNLLKNALEATPRDKDVHVNVTKKGDVVSIAFSNYGSVPEEIRESFFEEFTTHGKTHGTGLGTYSARLITETLGGSISLDTSEDDKTTILLQFG